MAFRVGHAALSGLQRRAAARGAVCSASWTRTLCSSMSLQSTSSAPSASSTEDETTPVAFASRSGSVHRPYGTGRRKSSVARVWLDTTGEGEFIINKRAMADYFDRDAWKTLVLAPLVMTDLVGKVDVHCNVSGGGLTGQAGAIRLGLSRAIVDLDEQYRHAGLRKQKMLTRDPRRVERKKPGQKKARKKFAWVKR